MNVLICSIYRRMSSISDSRLRSCSNSLRISSISESRLRTSIRNSSTSILRWSSTLLLSHTMCDMSSDCLRNECDQIDPSL
ncbi:hypothetical protein Taro_010269 [Colocasia esculenta]|uniref:Uncharacterized protein n=1 Tax=Colocasia esculenta TaxID=4460 RepID=A0A843U754_COLES|nr:hypothetical protein [Colocasia esculenta]